MGLEANKSIWGMFLPAVLLAGPSNCQLFAQVLVNVFQHLKTQSTAVKATLVVKGSPSCLQCDFYVHPVLMLNPSWGCPGS